MENTFDKVSISTYLWNQNNHSKIEPRKDTYLKLPNSFVQNVIIHLYSSNINVISNIIW